MEALHGGRAGKIWREGKTVRRPAGPWTPTVHRFLRHLRSKGFMSAPTPIAIDGTYEVVSYVDGRVCEHLGDQDVGSEQMLASAGKLLRYFHRASEGFLETDRAVQTWFLQAQEPEEIVCHGDFAPYNVTAIDGIATGIIDFDTAHPAPALWDLAYAIYRWAPLSDPSNHGVVFAVEEQFQRATIFCDAYGATHDERLQLPEVICRRLTALVNFVHASAEAGDEIFVQNVEAGHTDVYLRDIVHIQRQADRLISALTR